MPVRLCVESIERLTGAGPLRWYSGRPSLNPRRQALAFSEQRTHMPRLGKPDNVAATVLFLASDECSYTPGINLVVDGG